uniref:Uncharacterized protein n=1 Tax=Arundo donax TaxID=35708 RepID=A0A0A9ELK6_ARUDO
MIELGMVPGMVLVIVQNSYSLYLTYAVAFIPCFHLAFKLSYICNSPHLLAMCF